MRIGQYELRNMKRKILEDLYNAPEAELDKRRASVAQTNRQYYIEPLEAILDKLPIEMITYHQDYCLVINYNVNPTNPTAGVAETWKYKSQKPVLNPHEVTTRRNYNSFEPARNTLNPRLQSMAAQLCNDIVALRIEKAELQKFLHDTTYKYSGSLQLRKIWPEAFHKYLPVEPAPVPRAKRGSKVPNPNVPADPETPTFLKTRLTTNLLEGN